MTEEEAKSKWCPMVRCIWYPTPTDSGWNRVSENVNCVGSECMMWRWKTPLSADIDGNYYSNGFCGLGGKE